MIVLSLFLALAAAAQSQTDVLAQMTAGKMLCANPDLATKTCTSIASHQALTDGTFTETAEILLSPDQPITFETSMVVQIENGSVCGTMTEAEMRKGIVRFNGSPLPPDRSALAVDKIVEKLKPMAGRQVCDVLQIEHGQLMKYGQIERVDLRLPGKPVSWISPADSYKVAPR